MIAKRLDAYTDLDVMARVGHTELDADARAELIEEAIAEDATLTASTYRSPVYAHPGTP